MKLLLILLLMVVMVAPVSAQLDLDETGCETFVIEDEQQVFIDFERVYVIASIEVTLTAENEGDLRLYLPDSVLLKIVTLDDTSSHTWTGNQPADSILLDISGAGGITGLDICQAQPADAENALWLLTQTISESMAIAVGLISGFIIIAVLFSSAAEVFN